MGLLIVAAAIVPFLLASNVVPKAKMLEHCLITQRLIALSALLTVS
jgi:hypothetical protein